MKKRGLFSVLAILIGIICVNVYANSSYDAGYRIITSTYSSTTDAYHYTDANAYAMYDVSDISLSSSGYAKFTTTLKRKNIFSVYSSISTKTTTLTSADVCPYLVWKDIKAGYFKYTIKGEAGTVYTNLEVGSL